MNNIAELAAVDLMFYSGHVTHPFRQAEGMSGMDCWWTPLAKYW